MSIDVPHDDHGATFWLSPHCSDGHRGVAGREAKPFHVGAELVEDSRQVVRRRAGRHREVPLELDDEQRGDAFGATGDAQGAPRRRETDLGE